MDKSLKFASLALSLSLAVLNITFNPFVRARAAVSEVTCPVTKPGTSCSCCSKTGGGMTWTCTAGTSYYSGTGSTEA